MKTLISTLASLGLAMSVTLCSVEARQNQSASKVARKFDEYRYGSGSGARVGNDCDVDARLDNFAYSLREDPNTRGYMISYRWKRGERRRGKIYLPLDDDRVKVIKFVDLTEY